MKNPHDSHWVKIKNRKFLRFLRLGFVCETHQITKPNLNLLALLCGFSVLDISMASTMLSEAESLRLVTRITPNGLGFMVQIFTRDIFPSWVWCLVLGFPRLEPWCPCVVYQIHGQLHNLGSYNTSKRHFGSIGSS